MTTTSSTSEVGQVVAVEVEEAGGNAVGDHPVGATVIQLDDASDFPELGGTARVGDTVIDYTAADTDLDTLTLAASLVALLEDGDRVFVDPPAPTTWAQVIVDPEEGALLVEVPFGIKAFSGIAEGDLVRFTEDGGTLRVVELVAGDPSLDASYVNNAADLVLENERRLGEVLADNEAAIDQAATGLAAAQDRLDDAFTEIDLKPDQGYVDAAKQQAIDAAALDAAAKADAARDAAITDAQDAVSAAEAILQQAILDGDAAAIADAEAKIATAKAAAIDAAADDAAAKASAAQAAAEQAAQEALTQAQTDLEDAIASGDTAAISAAEAKIATAKQEAITAAASDATAKAGEAMQKANAALTAAQSAQATADNAIRTYYSETPPWANNTSQPDDVLGDMWYRDSTGQAYRWNGTSWKVIQDASIGEALAAAQSAQTTADGKITAYYQASEPLEGDEGDLWFDTDDDSAIHRRTGGQWVDLLDPKALADAAEQAAKAAAAKDATAKAEAAEAAAAQTAAADATAKANQAKADAEAAAQAYADQVAAGEGSGALAAAKEYAEQKAADAQAAAEAAAAADATAKAEAAQAEAARLAALDATRKADAAQAAAEAASVPSVSGDNSLRVYRNLAQKRESSPVLPGSVVIDTPITFSAKMTKVSFSGYNYVPGRTEVLGEIGFYAYQPENPWVNTSFTNLGSAPVTARLARKIDTQTASIVLDAGDGWKYCILLVTEASVSNMPNTTTAGWAIRRVEDLSEYENVLTPIARDLNDIKAKADKATTDLVGVQSSLTGLEGKVDGKANIFVQPAAPTGLVAADKGDIWINDGVTPRIVQVWTGSSWVEADSRTTQAVADIAKKTTTFTTTGATAPAAPAGGFTAGDLWLDVNGKIARWSGSAWVTAVDPKALADQAETNAKAFATTRTDGLAKTLWSTSLPGTTKAPQNSVWYRTDASGKIIAVFTQTAAGSSGNTWVARPITSEAIDNLDVGKLTAASGVVNDLVANTFATKLANIIQANIGNLTVTGDTHLEDLVAKTIAGDTASFMKLTVDQILAGFLQAQWIITETGSIIAGDPEGARVEITSDGIRVFVLGYNGIPYEAVSMVNGEVSFAVVDQTRGMLGGISRAGNVTGQQAAFSKSVSVRGTDVLGQLGGSAAPGWMDLLARGILPGRKASSTTTAYRSSNTEAIYLRCKATLYPNRLYRVVSNMEIQCNTDSGVARQRIRMATGGAAATTSSPLLGQYTGTPGYSSIVSMTTRVEDILSVDVVTKVEIASSYLGINNAGARANGGDLYIEDVGARGIDPGGGDGEAAKTLYTTTWRATASRGYSRTGAMVPDKENKIDLWLFGDVVESAGVLFGGTAHEVDDVSEQGRTLPQALNSATVHRVELQVTNVYWWGSDSTSMAFNTLSSSSLPSTKVVEGYTLVRDIPEGSAVWVDLDPNWFTNGTNRGVTMGDKDGLLTVGGNTYQMGAGVFQGPSDPDAPLLRVTYSR